MLTTKTMHPRIGAALENPLVCPQGIRTLQVDPEDLMDRMQGDPGMIDIDKMITLPAGMRIVDVQAIDNRQGEMDHPHHHLLEEVEEAEAETARMMKIIIIHEACPFRRWHLIDHPPFLMGCKMRRHTNNSVE